MDPAEISQRAGRVENPCADGETEPCPPPPTSVSKVLDDVNLLPLIIARVGFPTSLLCAALVRKRWLGVASDPAFLRQFRKLHPPNLLGFCVDLCTVNNTVNRSCIDRTIPHRSVTFVPTLPHPAELAVVVRHLEAYEEKNKDSCSSSLDFIGGFWNSKSTEKSMSSVLPSAPNPSSYFISQHSNGEIRGLSHVYSLLKKDLWKRKAFTMDMYTLKDGSWHKDTSATTRLSYTNHDTQPLLVDTKVYMRRADRGDILVLDLTASSFSTIQLPQGVEYHGENTMLSPADDSQVCLMHLKRLQLRIWLRNGDSWLLVDTICLRQLCDIPSMSGATDGDENNALVRVSELGNKDEFVLLKTGQCALCLDIKRRALRKVYEVTQENQRLSYIRPFRMFWPPIFPAPKDDPARMPCEDQGYEYVLG